MLGLGAAVLWALGMASPLPATAGSLRILNPLDGSLFPADIRSPEIKWEDDDIEHFVWRIRFSFRDKNNNAQYFSEEKQWTPSRDVWDRVKMASLETPARLEICGMKFMDSAPVACARIQFTTSKDAVGAPIFYRAVPNPFPPMSDHVRIKWKLGWVSSYDPPIVVMQNQSRCFNCHAASFNGKVFGFTIEHEGLTKDDPRGGYIIFQDPGKKVVWKKSDYFDWNAALPPSERDSTSASVSAISPDGRFIVSSIGIHYIGAFSQIRDQLIYSVFSKGSLYFCAIADRHIKPLPGADDERFNRYPTSWSPDGQFIYFGREPATTREEEWRRQMNDPHAKETQNKMGWEALDKIYPQQYDIYRIPFNDGRGGREVPVQGASRNGKSNYCPKVSPDGEWLVFNESASGRMLMRPDTKLWIVPANGGKARKLRCNGPGANSWHSWSPNSRWLVFSSKAYDGSPLPRDNSPTDLALTHIDANGNDSPRIILTHLRDAAGLSANIPEFFNIKPGQLEEIDPGELGTASLKDSAENNLVNPVPNSNRR